MWLAHHPFPKNKQINTDCCMHVEVLAALCLIHALQLLTVVVVSSYVLLGFAELVLLQLSAAQLVPKARLKSTHERHELQDISVSVCHDVPPDLGEPTMVLVA